MYNDVLISFTSLYSYEYLGIYPAYFVGEALIQQTMSDYPAILDSTTQGRFLSLIDKFYSAILGRANTVWESLSQHLADSAHEEAMRGSVREELTAVITEERKKMDGLKVK